MPFDDSDARVEAAARRVRALVRECHDARLQAGRESELQPGAASFAQARVARLGAHLRQAGLDYDAAADAAGIPPRQRLPWRRELDG